MIQQDLPKRVSAPAVLLLSLVWAALSGLHPPSVAAQVTRPLPYNLPYHQDTPTEGRVRARLRSAVGSRNEIDPFDHQWCGSTYVLARPETKTATDPQPPAYAARPAAKCLADQKATIVTRLSDDKLPELAGFRSYAEAFFPILTDDMIRANAVATESPEPLIPAPLVFDLFERADNVLSRLRLLVGDAIDPLGAPKPLLRFSLTLNLRVLTLPQGAEVAIQPAYGGQKHTTTSDAVFSNIYRGLYEYSVTRTGFKPIKGPLNLVDDSRGILECTLHATGDAQDATPCVRKAP